MTGQTGSLPEIEVKTDSDGKPLNLKRNGRMHRVLSIYEHWRIADGWWAEEIRRDYFRVETAQGLVYDIYHDLVAGRWYLSKLRD
ncbi:MAG: hypothetical protein HY670_10625 [Chloroflexi bacterium]|nr:hypothetical protein [Chloroflexota bacterium]